MVALLEQQIAEAEREGDDPLVECLVEMKGYYARWESVTAEFEDRCDLILGDAVEEPARPAPQ